MKILVLTNRIPWPLKDGGSVAVYQMLQSQVRCGFQVKLLSLNTNKHFQEPATLPAFFNTIGLEAVRINTDVKLSDAVKNLFTGESYNVIRFESEAFRIKLMELLKDNVYDIILFESIYLALYLDTARNYSKAKLVLRAHNVEFEIWQQAAREGGFITKKYFRLLAKRLEAFEKKTWKQFDAIIPISSDNAYTIKHFCDPDKTKLITLPAAIDIRDTGTANNASVTKLYHLGSMEWIPNQQAMKWFLDEVWKRIAFDTKAEFFLAGRNMPEEFFHYAGERVHIVGEVDSAEDFISDKQIMVVPLFAGSGLRIKILEAMAFGKTVITTSVGMQGIEAENGKEIMIANNAKAFADAVRHFLQFPDEALEMGARAKELIRNKYSMESFESKLKEFYLQITGR
jgi:glycosyltransferase involved in cell wall biosynthesis